MRDEDKYIIRTPVPTPEEMADYLGVSRERLAELRRIMESPAPPRRKRKEAPKPGKRRSRSRTVSIGQIWVGSDNRVVRDEDKFIITNPVPTPEEMADDWA